MSNRGYGVDLRVRVVAAYEAGKGSLHEVAEDYDVAVNTLLAWRTLRAQTGDLRPRPHGGGNPSKVQAREERWLREWLQAKPDLTLPELVERFARKGVELSQMAVSRALRRLGITRKKSRATRPSGSVPTS
jgi:transposase